MRRGLAPSREQAQAVIAAGRVTVGGAPAPKASRLVAAGEAVEVLGDPPRFVGRGGEKLDAALHRFAVDVRGRRAVDAGASTGGFTDCLLQRGARHVVAVDVGHGQFDAGLRQDARVTVMERTNVRSLGATEAGGEADLVCADLSFISLRTVAGALIGLVAPGGDLIVLVKPQFEAGRVEASRGSGVIRDPAVWRRVLEEVRDAFLDKDAAMLDVMVSPLEGAHGNVEFLAHLRRGAGSSAGVPDLAGIVAEASARQGR